MAGPPEIIEAQVVPAENAARAAPSSGVGPPIHPLSALLLLVVDNLWNLAEWLVIDWFITIPLSFLSVAVPVFFLQKVFKKDPTGRALGYALLLGVIAAVPFSVTGTPVGIALLAWTGIGRWLGPPRSPRPMT